MESGDEAGPAAGVSMMTPVSRKLWSCMAGLTCSEVLGQTFAVDPPVLVQCTQQILHGIYNHL